ncbi:hypothetical protein LTR10_020663 [Elasticomyces elasticus]|uniref:FAD/NAD(P)-binding domain-containing protein n=1 Tax=Exophiala sideris TaxID=1016849 RepID=A0ABR0J7S8_9EURO|nr:hypothetical protein LTR10_020663 [Elasticomyces elasticus]KAK5030013.1 hypothetical protein LTS07_005737 [Exophiala sideris]KAK5031546.1 hypothetical protein LTR13_007535 [Exophiala sideris]KAK5058223.1 hypothetical protein LTR69_006627 [Exophiala sideris]KAK5180153.1 hypothetical protein LTR44_007278 [Eurotiomycetes sp. CCFEE 6388]
MFDAVVVGSGAAGIATVGNILECHESASILWIDPEFNGGRITKKYLDVSSNTKVAVFLQFAHALEPFREIVRSTPKPNAVHHLECLDTNGGCDLQYASDMLLMLTEGLKQLPNIQPLVGTVVEASYDSQSEVWSIQAQDDESSSIIHDIYTRKLVLCTGSSPSVCNIGPAGQVLRQIDLDIALDRPTLREKLWCEHGATVAVIGSSHSAIVVIMHLFELATTTHPRLKIKWFTRKPLRYATQMEGWILLDNNGLKGKSADFARTHLEDDKIRQSHVGQYLEKFDCSVKEDEVYQAQLPQCTHVVQAIGFTRDPVPPLRMGLQPLDNLAYDNRTGLFHDSKGQLIPGLCGAGIAFPERVVDPAGNAEYAVGFWKFMRYLRRVVPEHWDISKQGEMVRVPN